MVHTFDDAKAPELHEVRYFEIMGAAASATRADARCKKPGHQEGFSLFSGTKPNDMNTKRESK